MDIRQQLLAAFEAEHREHLDAIRAALAGQAAGRPADWNDVFRRAHSLKGASRAVDLPPVEAVAHRLETLFERISTGAAPLDDDALAATHLALDRIEAFVADMKSGTPTMPADALSALETCLTGEPSVPAPAVESAPSPSAPPAAPALSAPEPAEAGQAVLRVPAAAVEALTAATYGLAHVVAGRAAFVEGLERIGASVAELRGTLETIRARDRDGNGSAARAGLGALDAGLTALARLSTDLMRGGTAFSMALDGAAIRVREEAERLALVPAESVFGGFARGLRETARGEGREVSVTVRGLDVPLDRAMLQALKDPVLHALRNALSHGFEPPEVRQRAGKPAALAILFEVAVRGGKLSIAVHDDGGGPDLAAIERRARDRGLLSEGEAADRERLLGFVFEPGFSTSSAIDTLSGRGIGLAVVADAVRRLQGGVRLEPRAPHGTSLVMSLPLSAARQPVVIVETGEAAYALPSGAVERVLHLDRADLATVAGRPVLHLSEDEGRVALPVAELGDLVGTPARERAARAPAILMRCGGRRCVLLVERLSDVRTLLVLPAPPFGVDAALVTGTVILGDDRPLLVLDADGLAARLDDGPAHRPEQSMKPYVVGHGTRAGTPRSTILVVDDSITTRTLEKSILEAAGYRVVVCVDGQDALDHLRSGLDAIDLVVADVEMPRLDGFGLVKALRGEPAFTELPVILMTSRGATEDVARGLELGADAYLTKQKFDQRELLDTIGQLL